jgi:hypothetical protein
MAGDINMGLATERDAALLRLGAIRTAFDRWDGGQGDQWELLNELERILKGGAVETSRHKS